MTSNVDTEKDDLINMSTYLRIDSSEESSNDNEVPSKSHLALGSACYRYDSENDDNPVHSTSPSARCMTVSSARSSSSAITINHATMIMIEMNRIVLIKSLVR